MRLILLAALATLSACHVPADTQAERRAEFVTQCMSRGQNVGDCTGAAWSLYEDAPAKAPRRDQ